MHRFNDVSAGQNLATIPGMLKNLLVTFFILSPAFALMVSPVPNIAGAPPLQELFKAQGVPAEAVERSIQYLEQNAGKYVQGGEIGNTRVEVGGDNMVVIDYSLPSTQKRLYHLNLKTGEVQKFYVAHGKNSGVHYSTSFSNVHESKTSSLGMSVVGGTYSGFYGKSIRLYGLEKSNSKMEDRYIVMHGAPYVSPEFIEKNGRLGRSWGCPAVEVDVMKLMIETLTPGSLVYLYHKDLLHDAFTNPNRQDLKDQSMEDQLDIDLPGEEEDIKSRGI